MAADNKHDLVAVTEKEFGKLERLIASLEPDIAMKTLEDDTCIKDIIGHRAHWIELFLGWYADGQAGKPVFFPAEGYKWNDLKRYNADLRQRQADLDWPDAVALLRDNHARLTSFIADQSDDTLYGGPMKGANNAWTPGRWAEAAGASHYRSASKFIRAATRALARGVAS
ncbi:ClbS/DfsB family four-helix bundle protein [uncultured Tateyamaria sp.]|uniref:ClbS/DfsB family four-helix bundle protein n=1 Tax=uncultured Tateyamaria sp. TaxID=455651 RepID=UPI002622ADA2|nr:ClbS/DfsB family four-helix bundle protein [uncultured Tateyamaria sp.]